MTGPADGWLDRNGVDLHFLEWKAEAGADAPSAVLLHGLGSNAHYWRRLASRLSAWRLVALDQRGHGLSGREPHAPAVPDGFAMDELVADVMALIRELGVLRPLVIGHSWGATVALEVASRHPEGVSGLAFIDGPIQSAANLFSWDEAQSFMQPPLPRYSSYEDAEADVRRDFAGAYGDDLMPFVMARLVQSGTELVLSLTSEARLELLRGLYDAPVDQHWVELDVPAVALLARGGPARIADSRKSGAQKLAAANPRVRVHWFDTPHDIPLFAPGEVADQIDLLLREARAVSSEAPARNDLQG